VTAATAHRADLLGRPPAAEPTPLLLVAAALATCATYMILGILSRQTVFPDAGVSLVWLPAGFGVGMVARSRRPWLFAVIPGLVVGELLADLVLFDFPPVGTLLFVFANLVEQVLIGLILKRLGSARLSGPRDIVVLVLVTMVVVPVTGLLGATATAVTFGTAFGTAWLTWYMGSVTSIVLVAPLVISLHRPGRVDARGVMESLLLGGATVGLSLIIFTQPLLANRYGAAALIVPLLAWLGVGLGFAAVAAVSTVVVFVAGVAAARSVGPFSETTPDLTLLLSIQAFLVLACATVYAAALIERQRRWARDGERAAWDQLRHQARHDALTGLLNRYGLSESIDDHVTGDPRAALPFTHNGSTGDSGSAAESELAMLFCDLDGFKDLNDTVGHHIGDLVLRAVAQRIRDVAGPDGSVARIGGDEFVILREVTPDSEEPALVAECVQESLTRPIRVEEADYEVGVSIGIARVGSEAQPPAAAADLMRRADIALHVAKSTGRGRCVQFDEQMDLRLQRQMATRAQLLAALDDDRIDAWFQPIVDVRTAAPVGAEALARLRLPDGRIVMPDLFIEEAEIAGLIDRVDQRVLRQGLAWAARQDGPHAVAVNVSARELAQATYPAFVLDQVDRAGLAPGDLTLEVSERVIMDAGGVIEHVLVDLRTAGVDIAIDDFGTGYSSLNALRRLPANLVKIDRSFTMGMMQEPEDAAIVRAVIHVAQDLGRIVVAEGVETREQFAMLADLGCDRAQGYFFGRPSPATLSP
jgi:diguanylate cyclase (GGDEF)-like protein